MAYDFSGYATRNDIRCADGRVIRHDAFKDNDGETVPLVWQHVHDNPTNVLGHALLENRDDGVYCYGTFNNTESGQHAKEMVANGDITSMSIYANRLQQNGSDVVHGMIREVSLVLTGANPGAYIDNISFAHADGSYTDSNEEAIIYSGIDNSVNLYHAEDSDDEEDDIDESDNQNDEREQKMANGDKTVEQVFNTLTDEQKDVVYFLIGQAVENASGDGDMSHAEGAGDPTVKQVFDTLTDEQKDIVYFLIGQAMQDASGDEAEHAYYDDSEYEGYDDDYDGGSYMKHNVFDGGYQAVDDGINVDEINEVLRHADSRTTSLKAYMEDNGYGDLVLEHGVQNLNVLYPEAQTIRPKPDMITRNQEWVNTFWGSAKRTPFARIKSVAADLTPDAARAKGYIKANQKEEEVFALFSRETTPQTIYKKQKLDRDDIVDITDIDIVGWLKEELRVMLIEEICRAALVSDGRAANVTDKIKQDKIRPIYQDDDQFTIHYQITWDPTTATTDDISNEIVKGAVRARKEYRGSGGNLVFFGSSDIIADMLLREDKLGRRIYKDESDLAAALRVKKIIEVPILDGVQRSVTNNGTTTTYDLMGLIVNPADYTFGTDKGGAVTLFDDFDIDFNQQKYLLETRLCGCLTIPFSAIAIEADDTIVNPT